MTRPYPHEVTIKVPTDKFLDILAWLRDAGHELHRTVIFGHSNNRITLGHSGEKLATVDVHFKDPNAAMLFKLAWHPTY